MAYRYDGDQHTNRPLGYDVTDVNPADGTSIAVEQTRYYYGPADNVMLLIRQLYFTGDGVIDQGDLLAAAWWFYYDTSNKLWLAVQGMRLFDESTGALTAVPPGTMPPPPPDKAAEYRYDGGRQRYLVRQRDPTNNFAIVGTGQWRDYMGNNIYNDYTVDVDQTGVPTVTNGTSHLPGIGFDDPSMADMPAYYGSDLIGTTRRVVDSSTGGTGQGGTGVSPVVNRTVLTAFGEPISTAGTGNTRYGYAGEWGYETPEQSFDPLAELGWQHVGARYYDPAVGRFMQRDPIGIREGTNTYLYLFGRPTIAVDPTGQGFLSIIGGAIGGAIGGFATGFLTGGGLAGGLGGAIAGGIAGGVNGVLHGTGFGNAFVSSLAPGALAGIGGGLVAGLAERGATLGGIVIGGAVGGGIAGGGGAALAGGGPVKIVTGTALGCLLGGLGGAAGQSDLHLVSEILAADSETIGQVIGGF